MELIFNEQSIIPSASDEATAYQAVVQFVQTCKEATKYGFNRVRFEQSFDQVRLLDSLTLNDLGKRPYARTVVTLMRGMARHPFIDNNSPEEERFVNNNFFITKDSHKTPVDGLGVAYIYNTAAISLGWDQFWDGVIYPLQVEGSEEGTHSIVSLSKPEHCSDPLFTEWIEHTQPVVLFETHTVPSDKRIALRDDHGKDKLEKFAKSILNSIYVMEVINSLPHNSQDTKFIRRVYPDGKIEIVLHKTDKGYGMIIQTTGRNLKETERIAKLLAEKYYT